MSNFQRTHHFSLSRTLLLHPEFLSSFQAVKNKTYKTTRSWDNSLEPHIDYIKCMYSFGTNSSVSILISNIEILANQSITISYNWIDSNLVGSVGTALEQFAGLTLWTGLQIRILNNNRIMLAICSTSVALYPTPSQLKREGAIKEPIIIKKSRECRTSQCCCLLSYILSLAMNVCGPQRPYAPLGVSGRSDVNDGCWWWIPIVITFSNDRQVTMLTHQAVDQGYVNMLIDIAWYPLLSPFNAPYIWVLETIQQRLSFAITQLLQDFLVLGSCLS